MTIKFISLYFRNIKKWTRRRNLLARLIAIILLGVIVVYAYHMNTRRLSVDTSTYSPLMSLIGRIESSDNYNAYFGNPRNDKIKFTDMSINEVMKWQADFVESGNPSSAIGRYQIIDTTLAGLVRQLGIDTAQKFNEQMQDRMAIALLERRGSVAYVNNELTAEAFASNLAQEWAALPKVVGINPESSYYAGDGLNKSRTSPTKVLATIKVIKAK